MSASPFPKLFVVVHLGRDGRRNRSRDGLRIGEGVNQLLAALAIGLGLLLARDHDHTILEGLFHSHIQSDVLNLAALEVTKLTHRKGLGEVKSEPVGDALGGSGGNGSGDGHIVLDLDLDLTERK
jgi:hypothetical protein